MSKKRVVLIAVLSVAACLTLFAFWYKYTYSMDVAEEYEVNRSMERKLLIASQSSAFKNEVTKNIISFFEKEPLHIKVIDISSLDTIRTADYDAILLIHTWENWKPPKPIEKYLNKESASIDKIVVITTSGNGTSKMEEIDAITGESSLENVENISKRAINKLKPLLGY